jgi:outer membrane biosynthesis protein TonB
MKTASAISTGLHAAVLLWALVSFSGKTFEVTPAESLPVDLVSEKDFSEITKGVKTAPKAPIPKPLVEKVGETKPADDPAPKLTEKKEIKPQKEETAEPKPIPKPDTIAEKLKKQDDQKKQAKAEPPRLPPRKPPPKPQPKFEPDKIAALLDTRAPQRNAATGEQISAPTLGLAHGTAAHLSQSEIDALRARLRQCWNPPVGALDAANMSVIFRVIFRRDGSIEQNPVLVQGPASQFGPAMAESALRALLQCQPYTMLKPEHYDQWKDMQITFDPHDMFGG